MSGQGIDNLLQAMIRERDEFAQAMRSKLAELDEAIAARKKASSGINFFAFGSSSNDKPAESEAVMPPSDEFAGLAYPAMVHKALELQPPREPLTVNQILNILEMHGVVPEAQDPRGTVQNALNRRKKNPGDVVHTGLGEWGLREWYSESDLKKFALALNGANARDAEMHRAAMKKGIAASQARGAFYGKPPKITEEMWVLAAKLFNEKGYSLAQVHEEIIKLTPKGEDPIGKGALSNRRKQIAGGEPYPPRWKAYFDQKMRINSTKADLADASEKKIVSIK